jgi:WD40-like Beta Propeller Repeat
MRQGLLGLFALVALASVSGASGASVPPVSGLAVTTSQGSLVISSIYGGDSRPLTEPRVSGEHRLDYLPTWSPDGSMVAFARWTPQELSLMVVRSDGSGLGPVASLGWRKPEMSRSVDEIRWSPDGSKLAFEARIRSGRYGTIGLYVAALDGSGKRRIALLPKQPEGYFELFGWTPDGARVTYAFLGGEPISFHYDGPADLMTTSADGTDTTKVLREDEIDQAYWLADGSLIYVRNCLTPSACQLALRDPGSRTSRPLTHFKIPKWLGCCEWDWLDLMQRPSAGEIVYTHGRKVYDFSPATNRTRTVRVFRCPRKRCDSLNDEVTLLGISRDGRVALVEFDDYIRESFAREYRLDLETGTFTRIKLVTTTPAQIYLR